MSRTAKIANPMSGNQLYQERARMALPLLVRQAEAAETIFYSDLARELGMQNPRNLNYPLGSIGRTLEHLSKAWKEKIPPIQCVVINKNTNLPGKGIGWFLVKKEDFSTLSKNRQRQMVRDELARIFVYPRWREVLKAVKLHYVPPDFSRLMAEAAHRGSGGEGEGHRRLKNFVALNPSRIGLPQSTAVGSTEVGLPSGDVLDVSFTVSHEWIAAEVKSLISNAADITRGLFQCVKYQAVMKAAQVARGDQRNARALLVLEGDFPTELFPLKNILGVDVLEKIAP